MKKLKSLKLMLLAVISLFSMNAFAAESLVEKTIFKQPYIYTIKTVDPTAKTGTVWVKKNDAEAVTALNIPATFAETVEGSEYTGSMTFTVVKIEDDAFSGLTNLESVSIPSTVTAIGARAFAGCYSLATLTFASGSQLTTIGEEAFNAWIQPVFDLSGATSLTTLPDQLLMTDAAQSASGNTYVTEVKLPASLTTLGKALQYLPNLATLNISSTKVTDIAEDFLKNNTKITSIELPATVTDIAKDAFKNSAVTSLTINGNTTDGKPTIGALGKDIATVIFNNEFKGSIAKDAFTNATSVTFIGAFNGSIAKDAFTNATSVTFNGAFNGVIAAGGITLKDADDVFPTVTFGELKKVITTNAITGVTYNADKRYVTLKVGKINVDASAAGAIVSTGVKEATVTDVVVNKLNLDMFGSAIKVTFQGNIIASAASVEGGTSNTSLLTLDFGSIEIKAGAFAAASLQKYTGITAVTWTPADAKAVAAFAQNAFANAALGSGNEKITMTTTTKVAYTVYNWDGTDASLYAVKFVATAPVDKKNIEFAGDVAPDGFYYATYFVPTGTQAKIKKVNGLTLYSVYLDGENIYNNPLRVYDGYYYINGTSSINAGLIVKSKTNDPVEVIFGDADSKQSIQNAGGGAFDGLLYNNTANNITGAQIVMEDYSFTLVDNSKKKYSELTDPNNAIVKISNPAKTKNIQYADFDPEAEPTAKIPAYGFFVLAKKVAASAPRQVIWLDDMGNVTAIEAVETVAEKTTNGAIYNIAGQKVDASYKGLVIKNGKKFIQK